MRDLNPRLPVNKTDTLPAELMVPILKKYWEIINMDHEGFEPSTSR